MTHSYSGLPPFDGVVALLAAADHGSFVGAAEALGLTHGSVSRRISQLEQWLGMPVFDRQPRGVTLTPAGQRFAIEARRSVEALINCAGQWRPRRGREHLKVSVVPSFAKFWLLPRIAKLQGDDLSIELLLEHRVSDLASREADLAIRYGRGGWEGVDTQILFAETLLPVASPELIDLIGPDVVPQRLLDFPLIHDSDVSHWRAWFGQFDINYRPRARDRRFEDYDIVLEAAKAGLGIALLRKPLANDCLMSMALVAVSDISMPNPASHHLVIRQAETRSAVHELARRFLLGAADFCKSTEVMQIPKNPS